MKLTKMSLVAALLVGSSAFAIENTKYSGDAKLYYFTDDNAKGLFNSTTSLGQAKVGFGLKTDLTKTIKANANVTVLSTLGMENRIVAGPLEQTNNFDDSFWLDTLNISADFDKTNVTVGRMTLDTPLAWTETWSIAYNTFEAGIVKNTDLDDTTFLAGYIGGSNGQIETGSRGWVVADMNGAGNTNFSQFYNGAIVAAVVNNSYKPLTAQAWYYDVQTATTGDNGISAYWLQADYVMDNITFGAQYTGGTSTTAGVDTDLSAFAVKAAYEMKDTVTASLSFSQTGTDSAASKNLSGAGYSKLYTESWWTAIAGEQDTQTINLTLSSPVNGLFDFSMYYVMATQAKAVQAVASDLVLSELTLEAIKSFGKLDTSLVYINTSDEINNGAGSTAINSFMGMLTYNF